MAFELPEHVAQYMDDILQNAYEGGKVDFNILCSRLNAKVFSADFADSEVSGMVRRETDGSFSIYLNQKHHENRQRFTLAHELGHIISFNTGSYSREKLLLDGFIERKTLHKITDPAETEANEIAAYILMPAVFIEPYIAKTQNPTIEDLAKEFGVSTAAMSVRLNRLGYMTV
jgi:Zn-dependent peptidase ImmA (M78 family)